MRNFKISREQASILLADFCHPLTLSKLMNDYREAMLPSGAKITASTFSGFYLCGYTSDGQDINPYLEYLEIDAFDRTVEEI